MSHGNCAQVGCFLMRSGDVLIEVYSSIRQSCNHTCVGGPLDHRWPVNANDLDRPNHGIQTMYAFAEDAGGMERSRYFGFSKDLYHFDHFLGKTNSQIDHE